MLWLIRFLKIILILVCIASAALVMMQESKDSGLTGGAFGKQDTSYVGQHRQDTPEGKMARLTWMFLTSLLVMALMLDVLS